MAAKSSGGSEGRIRLKNQEMAAYMKKNNIKRSTCRCPICHGLIGIESLYSHLGSCKK